MYPALHTPNPQNLHQLAITNYTIDEGIKFSAKLMQYLFLKNRPNLALLKWLLLLVGDKYSNTQYCNNKI